MTYEEYIASPQWAKKRRAILKRDGYACQTCCETEQLEVHHKTYDNLFHEEPEDFITLCHWCHEAVTSTIRSRRYGPRLPRTYDVVSPTPQTTRIFDNVIQKLEVGVARGWAGRDVAWVLCQGGDRCITTR